jgi:hypothetical protein
VTIFSNAETDQGEKSMRPIVVPLVAIALLIVGIAPASAQRPTPAPISIQEACHTAVNGLDALTANLGRPDHLTYGDLARWPGDFDANTYFTVLDHLTLPEGYVLDYVFSYISEGDKPFLYVRQADTPPYTEFPMEWRNNVPDYLDSVLTDDTPEGYMQLVALDVMGEQFYLAWHAFYNDIRIVCDQDELEPILMHENGYNQMLPEDVQQAARELDVTPTVEIGEESVKVEVTIFTKWGGFLRLTYTISRDEPHTILEAESTTLVEYNCGVMF